MAVRDNLAAVEERITRACARAARPRTEVTLVVVSKTFPASAVDEAIAAGATDIGENRVQETRDKKPDVRGEARWHLIGHLQSNKAKDAVKLFEVVQTVDSIALARKLSVVAGDLAREIDALIEVKIGAEPQKAGVMPSDVAALVSQIRDLPNVSVRGLMTIPPMGTAEESRRYFRELRALRDTLKLDELSMGMSEDFETAIEEGATIVRVGRAIFGERH